MSASGWTCFHCGEHFPATVDGRAGAREHFGPSRQDLRDRLAQAEFMADERLAELRRSALEFERLRDSIDALLVRANVKSIAEAVEQLETLRSRLQAADAFSRVVFRLRPTVWSVAMVDAYGPGDHAPPAELGFPPGEARTSVELVLDEAASTSMRDAVRGFLARRPGA